MTGEIRCLQVSEEEVRKKELFEEWLAYCLTHERYPQEIIAAGQATGWYDVLHAIAERWGFELEIVIRRKL